MKVLLFFHHIQQKCYSKYNVKVNLVFISVYYNKAQIIKKLMKLIMYTYIRNNELVLELNRTEI